MTKATKFTQDNAVMFLTNLSTTSALIAKDNCSMIELLNDSCVKVEDINGQETWTFSDNSYVTRNADEYWFGADVADFVSQYN